MKKIAVLSLVLAFGVATAMAAGPFAVPASKNVQAKAQWAEVYRTPGGLVAGADLIVLAKHVASQPGRVVGDTPFTYNGFEIQSILKGVHDDRSLVVEQTGGQMKDGLILSIDDGGPFVPGHSYLLFLKAQGVKGVDPTDAVVASFNVAGAAIASAANWNGCYKFADFQINWYNGGTGDYFNVYEEEARTDANAWAPYTDVAFTPVAAAGTTDHINAYNAAYGATGWLSLMEIQSVSGCTVRSGRLRMNQTYLDNGSYTRTQKKAIAFNLIGKILGLTNQSGTAGCMDGTLNNPFPSAHDRDTINSVY